MAIRKTSEVRLVSRASPPASGGCDNIEPSATPSGLVSLSANQKARTDSARAREATKMIFR